MAINVIMPALEMGQETGKLVSWMKKEGESVSKGEPLLEVETDKAVLEIESPGDGVLAGVNAQLGEEVPVGKTIAWILHPGEKIPSPEAASAPSAQRSQVTASKTSTTSATASVSAHSRTPISPRARRLAQERGVDISTVRGSGSGGEILAEDILSAAQPAPPPPAAAAAASSVARLMAERTTQSWTTVPHFFLVRDLEAGQLEQTRSRLGTAVEKSHGVRPTLTDLLVALVARVAAKHPAINSSWTDGRVRSNPQVNIGVAVAVSDGVVATVIPGADKLGLAEIAMQSRDLATRARNGRLRPSDVTGGTFTISNLGMYEVDAFTAIIIPPQACILAVGAIRDRVVPVDGRPAVRPAMTVTLSCDHRVVDGARAALFMKDLAAALLRPEELL